MHFDLCLLFIGKGKLLIQSLGSRSVQIFFFFFYEKYNLSTETKLLNRHASMWDFVDYRGGKFSNFS